MAKPGRGQVEVCWYLCRGASKRMGNRCTGGCEASGNREMLDGLGLQREERAGCEMTAELVEWEG